MRNVREVSNPIKGDEGEVLNPWLQGGYAGASPTKGGCREVANQPRGVQEAQKLCMRDIRPTKRGAREM